MTRILLSGPVRYPDREISTDRGTLSIIETWPQKTNYLKIEHFSHLVAAELVFPQLPDVWAALSLLNIFPSRPLTLFVIVHCRDTLTGFFLIKSVSDMGFCLKSVIPYLIKILLTSISDFNFG